LTGLIGELRQIETLSKRLDRPFGIRIVGYTDDSGSERTNLRLSRERAEAVHRFLIDNGNLNVAMMAVGMGAQQPVDQAPGKNLRAMSRFAGFELINDAGFRQGSVR
jgi:OOP family OmpA-OmpF porin